MYLNPVILTSGFEKGRGAAFMSVCIVDYSLYNRRSISDSIRYIWTHTVCSAADQRTNYWGFRRRRCGLYRKYNNITSNETYVDTYLSDKLVQSTGNGTFETPDGQSIAWIYSGIGKPVDDRWVFYGIRLFNNTQSESLSLLNNSMGLSKNVLGNETDYVWILK